MPGIIQNLVRFTNSSHNMLKIELKCEETDLTETFRDSDIFSVVDEDKTKFMYLGFGVFSETKEISLRLICSNIYKNDMNLTTMLFDATGSFIFGNTASHKNFILCDMLRGFLRPLTTLKFPLTVKCELVIKKSIEELLEPFQIIDEDVPAPIQDIEKAPVQQQNLTATHTTDYCNAPIDCLRELSVNFRKLLDQIDGTDITIHVDDVSMKAHKVILRARSPVFGKMFDHDTSEAVKNEIEIKDIRASIMKELLTFLYAGTIENHDFDDACDLYYAADKYEVLSLRNACAKDLLRHLQVNNACQLLILATNHGDESLREKILEYIKTNVKEIMATKSFEELAKYDANLVVLLMRNAFLK